MKTSAPALASRWAIANPMPLEPPMIKMRTWAIGTSNSLVDCPW
jgi:hypothetical protein